MKPDLLYRFVNAMDKGEVAAFHSSDHLNEGKWQAQRRQLFDALLKMDGYNQKRLDDSLTDPDYRGNLASEKHRMLEAVMTTVLHLRHKRGSGKDPWTCLQQSVLLEDMGLADEASLMALEGIDLAEKVEDVFAELQLREQLRICFKRLPRARNLVEITENEYRLETVASKVSNLTRYALVCDKLGDHQKKYRVPDDQAVRASMRSLMEEEEMSNLSKAMSLPAQIRFAAAHAIQAESLGHLGKAEDHWNLCLSLWDKCPERIAYLPHFYRQALANLIGVLIRSGRTDHVPVLLKRMEQVPVSGRRASMLGFCDVELQYQFYYMNTDRLKEALQRENSVRQGIRLFGKLMTESKELSLLFNFGIIHLVLGNDREAKDYFSVIRDKGILHSRLDLQGLARIFRLLLLLEYDPNDQFHYFLRSYKRTFRKDMPFYRMEDVVYKWLTKHQKKFHSTDNSAHLLKLHQLLEEFEVQRLIGAEELRLWALSRATGKSIRTLMANEPD